MARRRLLGVRSLAFVGLLALGCATAETQRQQQLIADTQAHERARKEQAERDRIVEERAAAEAAAAAKAKARLDAANDVCQSTLPDDASEERRQACLRVELRKADVAEAASQERRTQAAAADAEAKRQTEVLEEIARIERIKQWTQPVPPLLPTSRSPQPMVPGPGPTR
jgi:hypothetical protein